MTYENWCANSDKILKQAKRYNKWRNNAKRLLLTNLGPRIAKLGDTFYIGCGFHYSMELSFANLVKGMAYPWQPCANHLDKIQDQIASNQMNVVLFSSLKEQVREAEGQPKRIKYQSETTIKKMKSLDEEWKQKRISTHLVDLENPVYRRGFTAKTDKNPYRFPDALSKKRLAIAGLEGELRKEEKEQLKKLRERFDKTNWSVWEKGKGAQELFS